MRQLALALAAILSLIFMPTAANAATLSCTPSGGMTPGTQFYEANVNAATGACVNPDPQNPLKHIASQVICKFVVILNNVLGKVYCGIQFSMVNILAAVLTLYVAVFGVQILMGTTQLNAREILLRLIKIGAVWVFATQSAWGIGIIFNFFMALINDASSWVVNSVSTRNPTLFPVVQPDTTMMPLYTYIDTLIYNAVAGPFTSANNKVVGFFVATLIPFWPLFLMVLYWVWETFLLIVNTLLGFMMCLSAIAFLITLTPIFLSFMLFQTTRHFFESWLRYLASYALQVVFVFAIISLWIAVMSLFAQFFNELSDLIFPYQPVLIGGPVANPINNWAICPAVYGNGPMGPTAACPAGFDPFARIANPDGSEADFRLLIPPAAIVHQSDFLYFIIYHMITLILIAYTFGVLLKNAHRIASSLSASGHTPVLSPGWGNRNFGRMIGNVPDMLRFRPGQ